MSQYPTGPFKVLQLQDPEIVGFSLVKERLATDFKAPKLWKGRSGSSFMTYLFALMNTSDGNKQYAFLFLITIESFF